MSNGRIEKGHVYASTHGLDRETGTRQRRLVVEVDESDFAWLRSERSDGSLTPATRVRLRNRRLPNHRLVSEADA